MAAHYCLRLCMLIPQALTEEMFQAGQSKWMKGISEVAGKASVDGELPGRCPVWDSEARRGRVYTQVIPNTKAQTLRGIIQGQIVPLLSIRTHINPLMFEIFQISSTSE